MKQSVYIFGGVFVCLLGLSWANWTGALGSREDSSEVLILRAEVSDINALTYHDDKLDVKVDLKEDSFGKYSWVDLTEKIVKKKRIPKEQEEELAPSENTEEGSKEGSKEGSEEETAPEFEEEVSTEKSTFKGGSAVDTLVESLAPLSAIRELEQLSKEDLESIGLAEETSWLEIDRKGSVKRLIIGGEAWGTKNIYVKDADNSKVFLVKSDVLRPLKYAKSRLPDKRLFDLESDKITKIILTDKDGISAVMLHRNIEDKEAAFWASEKNPEKPVESWDNWLERGLRLKGLTLVEGEEPVLNPAFTMKMEAADAKPVTVQVLTSVDNEYYAKSEFTRGLFKLHKSLASELVAEIPDIIDDGDTE